MEETSNENKNQEGVNGSLQEEIAQETSGVSRFKMAAIFIIAIVIGIAVKAEAAKYLIIGYDDYRLASYADDFKLSENIKSNTATAAEDQNQKEVEDSGASKDEQGAGPQCGG